jgi:hypothetical protein
MAQRARTCALIFQGNDEEIGTEPLTQPLFKKLNVYKKTAGIAPVGFWLLI